MRKIKTFMALAVGLSVFWLVSANEAAAETHIKGSLGFSANVPSQYHGSQRTVTIIKDASGQETVIIEEKSPVIITAPRHGKVLRHRSPPRRHYRQARPYHRPGFGPVPRTRP
ncbi:MAG: hypothetical protein LBF58_07025 [Deltaproteobacteria bacterium]|nr:hypothetical protein [Deltaproteobacteria bacterium]